MTITIPAALYEQMLAHCRACLPDEAGGLLGGRMGRVEVALAVRNAQSSPVSYELDSHAQLHAMKRIEADRFDLVGIYHSHPTSPAYPSRTDVERAFFPGTDTLNFPEAVWVIVSLAAARPEARAFAITSRSPEGTTEVVLKID